MIGKLFSTQNFLMHSMNLGPNFNAFVSGKSRMLARSAMVVGLFVAMSERVALLATRTGGRSASLEML